MDSFFQQEVFNINGYILLVRELCIALGIIITAIGLTIYFQKRLAPLLLRSSVDTEKSVQTVKRILFYIVGLGVIILLLKILHLDQILDQVSNDNITIRISTIFQALLILQIARLLDWIISRMFIHNYYTKRDEKQSNRKLHQHETEDTANRTVQWAVYIFAIVMILRAFQIDFTIWEYTIKDSDIQVPFKLSNIFVSIIILLMARLVVWLITQLALYRYYQRNSINIGSQFAINQLLKYVVYVVALIIAIENLGLQMTVIWGGLAALMVGIGLGLQQTFNDFFSGIILLFERSVEVGDILEVNGMIGTVAKIGLRASLLETRDNMSVIVPNSHLVTQNVTNWSHFDDKMRFFVSIGVAYGTDTSLVKKTLLEVANNNPYVIDYPKAFVRFVEFGDSSLNFQIHFWCKTFITIEDIKSDIRFEIDQKFREQNIAIPFPQRDIWIRKNE